MLRYTTKALRAHHPDTPYYTFHHPNTPALSPTHHLDALIFKHTPPKLYPHTVSHSQHVPLHSLSHTILIYPHLTHDIQIHPLIPPIQLNPNTYNHPPTPTHSSHQIYLCCHMPTTLRNTCTLFYTYTQSRSLSLKHHHTHTPHTQCRYTQTLSHILHTHLIHIHSHTPSIDTPIIYTFTHTPFIA